MSFAVVLSPRPFISRLRTVPDPTSSLSDFHGRVHKTLAKQLARKLEPHQPLFIEEPLLPGHVEELKKLYQQTTIPIAVRCVASPWRSFG